MKRLWFYLSQPLILLVIVVLAILLVGSLSYPTLEALLNATPAPTSTPTATPTPTATVQTTAETTFPTPLPTSTNTPDVEATQTALAGLVAEGVSGTQTVEATQRTPTTAVAPTPTPTSLPTNTAMPTATTLPTSTRAGATPSSLGGDVLYDAPFDLEVTDLERWYSQFTWNWKGSLEEDEFFELRIWQPDGPHWGGAGSTKENKARAGLEILMGNTPYSTNRTDLKGATELCASVVVITTDPYRQLSPESEPVCWDETLYNYAGRSTNYNP